jgi:hypothetical protein
MISTVRGVFIGVQGGVTDLVKLVTHQVVGGRPCGLGCTDFLYLLGVLLLMKTRVHEVVVQTDKKPGRPATPWAQWSAAFGHCVLVSGTSLG